jgi:hypothetical protein
MLTYQILPLWRVKVLENYKDKKKVDLKHDSIFLLSKFPIIQTLET